MLAQVLECGQRDNVVSTGLLQFTNAHGQCVRYFFNLLAQLGNLAVSSRPQKLLGRFKDNALYGISGKQFSSLRVDAADKQAHIRLGGTRFNQRIFQRVKLFVQHTDLCRLLCGEAAAGRGFFSQLNFRRFFTTCNFINLFARIRNRTLQSFLGVLKVSAKLVGSFLPKVQGVHALEQRCCRVVILSGKRFFDLGFQLCSFGAALFERCGNRALFDLCLLQFGVALVECFNLLRQGVALVTCTLLAFECVKACLLFPDVTEQIVSTVERRNLHTLG